MTKLKDNYFEIKRAGINTTFQDNGRKNLNHIGIPISGAMDQRNYILANAMLKKDLNSAVIEFAYQGPLLKYSGAKMFIAITGDVQFQIIKNNKNLINGEPYKVYLIENQDQIDIQSTNKSVYGYLSISENLLFIFLGKRFDNKNLPAVLIYFSNLIFFFSSTVSNRETILE